jgi:hypothetical protein
MGDFLVRYVCHTSYTHAGPKGVTLGPAADLCRVSTTNLLDAIPQI